MRPLRVLVVDDDHAQLRALQRAVRGDKRIDLHVADNAFDALLHIGSAMPDLVVMDVYMPGLDGLEACRRLNANPTTRDVQVILTSATMTSDLERLAREAGADGTMSKPLDVGELFARSQLPDLEAPNPPVPTVRGADLLVSMLAEAGVEQVFGLPGGAISPVHDALLDSQLRMITTRHEAGAMFAAAGYAQTTGKLGVVAVTSGPGALNAMTGLASAWCDGLPLLLLVGEVPRQSQGRGVLQDGSAHGLQIVEMARHVTKLAAEVPRPSALPHLVRRAIATALSGRKGPVVLTLPLDVTTAHVTPPRHAGAVRMGELVSTENLDEIADIIGRAERPLILAGSGVRGHGASARLISVAERLACPVVTSPKAKGVFPETHPLALGVLGLGGHPSSRRYLDSGVDVVMAIGTSLGDLATDGFSPQLQASKALIHVDIDARQLGKSYSPTHAVVASAAEFLGGLADRLDARPRPSRGIIRAGISRHSLPPSVHEGRIASHQAIAEIQAALPADTIYTIDSGEHFLFAVHYLEISHPDSFIAMTGLGSMGQSIGAAIGAQLAYPKRSIAAICGDGCFAMNAFEIATAVEERLPIRIFVFNDERLGMVENGHKNVYGRSPKFTSAKLDVCAIAHGLGAAALYIDGPGKLRQMYDVVAGVKGPVVIEVRIDPDIALPKLDRVAAMNPGGGGPKPSGAKTSPRKHLRLVN